MILRTVAFTTLGLQSGSQPCCGPISVGQDQLLASGSSSRATGMRAATPHYWLGGDRPESLPQGHLLQASRSKQDQERKNASKTKVTVFYNLIAEETFHFSAIFFSLKENLCRGCILGGGEGWQPCLKLPRAGRQAESKKRGKEGPWREPSPSQVPGIVKCRRNVFK